MVVGHTPFKAFIKCFSKTCSIQIYLLTLGDLNSTKGARNVFIYQPPNVVSFCLYSQSVPISAAKAIISKEDLAHDMPLLIIIKEIVK